MTDLTPRRCTGVPVPAGGQILHKIYICLAYRKGGSGYKIAEPAPTARRRNPARKSGPQSGIKMEDDSAMSSPGPTATIYWWPR